MMANLNLFVRNVHKTLSNTLESVHLVIRMLLMQNIVMVDIYPSLKHLFCNKKLNLTDKKSNILAKF